ncbi:MAG: hypothetical protein ACYSWP_12730 [Planctomycetota bacterium]|jgi:hypothetical protein
MNQRKERFDNNPDNDEDINRGQNSKWSIYLLSLISFIFGTFNLTYFSLMVMGLGGKSTPAKEIIMSVGLFLFPLIAIITAICANVLLGKKVYPMKVKTIVLIVTIIAGCSLGLGLFGAMDILIKKLLLTGF